MRQDQGVRHSAGRHTLIPRTLCFVLRHREVLLLRRAPDKKIFPNKYNGVGGHVERGEDVRSSARREIREETGLEVSDLRLRGVIHVDTGEAAGIAVFVFTARAHSREVIPSGEGRLEWVPFDRIHELDLVEDLPTLLPKVLAMGDGDEPFSALYRYDVNDRLVIEFGA